MIRTWCCPFLITEASFSLLIGSGGSSEDLLIAWTLPGRKPATLIKVRATSLIRPAIKGGSFLSRCWLSQALLARAAMQYCSIIELSPFLCKVTVTGPWHTAGLVALCNTRLSDPGCSGLVPAKCWATSGGVEPLLPAETPGTSGEMLHAFQDRAVYEDGGRKEIVFKGSFNVEG